MKDLDLNKQFEALKRQATDLVREMHARRLAIPAAALLCAIVAALVLLPEGSTPPPTPPTAAAPAVQPKVARVAQVSLIEPSRLGEDIPLANSDDPFAGSGEGYNCTKITSDPKTFECKVADLKVRVVCTGGEASGGPCSKSEGASGGTGAAGGSSSAGGSSGSGGSSESTGGSGGSGDSGSNGGSSEPKTKSTYYTVTVSIDGTTKKNVEAGTDLPDSSDALAVYAGTNDSRTKGVFIAADGVVVTGVKVDETFGSFSLEKGKSATLTDKNGTPHKLTLKSISKVTK